MADTTLRLKVLLEAAGIKPTASQLEKLNKKLRETAGATGATSKGLSNISKEANKTKRNLEGVAQRSNRAGKDFSRMSQGMGGLVQAYATVAANVFALSSAFLVLRRTADLSSMIKSAEDFSSRFGVSVTRVTEQLQKATGGALSFAEALPIVNKAISAGIPIEKMEQLAIAATKASQTFGGSATEALNRFISASQRGRVEIIQTLGIVIKTEQAYKDYGAQIGKTALELSAFDRQQAILNATIEASQNVFDQVNIDPNPFQQLLTTITDLKDTIGTFVTDSLTPMFNAFNQSQAAAGALIAIIVKAVGGRIFPELSKGITALAIAGRESTKSARLAAARATAAAAKVQQELGKTTTNTSIKNIKKEEAAFRASLGEKIKAHKAFTATIFKQNGDLDKATLTQQRAALARELSARKAGKGMQTIFKGVPTAEIQRMLNVYNQVGLSIKDANVAQEKLKQSAQATTNVIKIGLSKANAEVAKFRAGLASLKSGLRSGFAQGFQIAEGKVVKSIRSMTVAWRILMRDIAAGTAKSGSHLANFGKAFGRTAGLAIGAIAGIGSFALSAVTYISLLVFAWERYGDALLGVTPAQRAVEDAAESFKEGLEKANEALVRGIELWGDKAPESLKDFKDSFQFLGGAFESISYEANTFSRTVINELNNLTVDQAVARVRELKTEIETIEQVRIDKAFESIDQTFSGAEDSLAPYIVAVNRAKTATEDQRKELEQLEGALLGLSKTSLAPLVNQFSRATGFAKDLGINTSKIASRDTRTFAKLRDSIGNTADVLQIAASGYGSLDQAIELAIGNVKDSPEELARVTAAIIEYLSSVSGELSNTNKQAAASLGQLQELGGRFNTFVLGLDKLRSQKSPFKEVFAFTLDAENALRDLVETQKDASSINLAEAFESGQLKADLKSIEQLLGGQTASLQDALNKATGLRKVYQEQLQVQLTGTEQLKVIQLELKNIKNREIKTDEQRLQQVYDTTERQLALTRKQGDLKFAEAKAQEALIAALGPVTDENRANVELEKLRLDLLYLQLDAYDEEEARLLKFTKYRLEDIKIQRDILTAKKAEINTLNQAITLNRKLVGNIRDSLNLGEDQYIARKELLRLEEQIVESRKAEIRLLNDGAARERGLAQEEAKLLLIRQQRYELERQQESRRALDQSQAGTIFSEDGLRAAAHFFRRALEDEIPKLKSSFEILGRGLSKTLIDTFDLIIDNLLEGGRNFAETVREGLKASLRDVFGQALKENIKQSFITIAETIPLFKGLTGNKDNTPVFQENMQNKTDTMIDYLSQIASNTGGTSNISPVPLENIQRLPIPGQQPVNPMMSPVPQTTTGAQPFTEVFKKNNNGQKAVVQAIEETTKAVEQPTPIATSSVKDLNAAPNVLSGLGILGSVVSASQGDSKAAIVQALFAIAAQIVAAQTATAGLATGGIIKGGTGPITPLATGGIVTGPSIALMGEGKNNEAVVPLPNNREIPVEMKGGGEAVTINMEQNFDFRNAGPDTVNQLRAEARNIEDRTFERVFSEINKGGRYSKMVGRR